MCAQPTNGSGAASDPTEIDAKSAHLVQLLRAEARHEAEIKARRRMRAALEAELLAPLVAGHEPHQALLAAWRRNNGGPAKSPGRRRRRAQVDDGDS